MGPSMNKKTLGPVMFPRRKKTGREVKCQLCGNEFSCGFSLRRHIKISSCGGKKKELKEGAEIVREISDDDTDEETLEGEKFN